MPERIEVDVPEGFPRMSEPVEPGTRYDDDDIELAHATEEDLPDVAEGLFKCFPEIWWSKHEPLDIRAPPDIRRARFAKRLKPTLTYPDFHGITAKLKSNGKIVGFAGWHGPNRPGFMGSFRRSAVDEDLKFKERMGWTDEEVQEMWQNVNVDEWEKEFGTYDRVRKEELGDEPHWYLAPYFVLDEYRGKGIGSKLMKWATDQADASNPPVPLYLEALPNARPVYLHYGFKGVPEGPDRAPVMLRRGPA